MFLMEYFHPFLSPQKFDTLGSLKWVGGIVVHDFILGFNYREASVWIKPEGRCPLSPMTPYLIPLLEVILIILLADNDYPPVDRDEVYKEIFEQAENFKKYQK